MRIFLLLIAFTSLLSKAQTPIQSTLLSKSKGKLTMLAYGVGEDRLGGAKMGYIDTGVLLKVIDSTKEMFLVRLSGNHTAYVGKSDLQIDSSLKLKPYYLMNAWSVRGDVTYDYVSIGLDEKLPYKSWMDVDPSKITVEIYGVQSNTNWITQLRTAKEVKNVYYNQVEDDVVRITIELKHKQHWGYSISYRGKSLVVRVRRQPEALKVNALKIAIDAGHGGANSGATGLTSKVLEKDYTIQFATQLEKLLKRKGAEVIMTRTTDTNINNVDRVLMLQKEMPDILVSLHLNSAGNTSAKGTSTYYKHIGFRPLTTSILNRMLQLDLNEYGNIGNFNFMLNAPTDFPNSLVEVAFLSNVDDEKKILDPAFHKQVAKKVYKGLRDFLKKIKR